MKIFEKREYTDGGPNDQGIFKGFILANSREEAKKKLNVNHGFLQISNEISKEEFIRRKRQAWLNYKYYKYIHDDK